ncbi:MAG TPA: hypothetical protein PLH97_03070, partial [Verrucomicrobiota bacterium]|nr:hypothetical protein [Verrucomicrobiota bacterium]
MRTASLLFLASLLLTASTIGVHAQARLKIAFSAVCEFTNSSGKISRRTINTRSILNDAAGRAGVSAKTLSLVYHIQGDPRGDLIQVVNNSDGSVVETVFMLFYPTLNGQFDGGFVAVTNAANTYVERPLFVFG